MKWLKNATQEICQASRNAALERQQNLTKPPGSLGRLEQLAIDFSGYQKCDKPKLERAVIRVFAGDHGVANEGVSAFPQAVTGEMIRNFAAGGAAISVLARQHDADFSVINLGTAYPVEILDGVKAVQLAAGTANFCEAAAMTQDQLDTALREGRDCCPCDADLFIGGDMGIGNTTSAAALYCALLNRSPDDVVGRGTGVDKSSLDRKRQAVQRALQLHQTRQPLDVLRCLGGLEIAALTGAYIGCAQRGVPSLVDGYVTTAAALVACHINPGVKDWLLFSHCSAESAHKRLLDAMQFSPLLDLGMRLGEGSGAALAIGILRSALKLHAEMATFVEAGVSKG